MIETKEKLTDPEAQLSKVQRTFEVLAPMCCVKKRSQGEPQLSSKMKQMSILNHEMGETLLCINLAKKGLNAVRDATVKSQITKYIIEYESLMVHLVKEKAEDAELDILNDLSKKRIADLNKKVPSELEEQKMVGNAMINLRRMENRLEMVTKKFTCINSDNAQIRNQIHRLLVDRNSFNIVLKLAIRKLVYGKEYLMDILEIASIVFMERDEYCRKLEDLKWNGLLQLNRDIAEMSFYKSRIKHYAKLEEFLRVKGSFRICEVDEIAESRRLDEIARCDQEIKRHGELLDAIFFSQPVKVDIWDCNNAREEKQSRQIADLRDQLADQKKINQNMRIQNEAAETTLTKVLRGINDLVRLSRCNIPFFKLLGQHKVVTKYNVKKYLNVLELEVKKNIEVVYSAVTPPAPTPTKGQKPEKAKKLVADPHIEKIRPNSIDRLVPYQPCAYCVEYYIMNLLFETPAVPADQDYLETIFHLQPPNTYYGIYSLTDPAKRHPYRSSQADTVE